MTNVMKSAWEIAYEGVEKFGGKVKEYFVEALKIAWNLFKKGGNEMNYVKQVKGTVSKINIPQLEGSEKQIAWAEQIRKNAAAELQYEVTHEEYEQVSSLPGDKSTIQKRSVESIIRALTSEEGINDYFVKMEANNLHESRFKSAVQSMNNALDRYTRFVEIMSNADAKFWIDNRDNQEKNYMFRAFREYVSKGIKKF